MSKLRILNLLFNFMFFGGLFVAFNSRDYFFIYVAIVGFICSIVVKLIRYIYRD